MQVKLVGGAVRDSLLGREPKDLDWLVTDKTEQEMEDMGFVRVGKSSTSPVFIHPDDPANEEYALPRKEVSTGKGYNDFTYVTEGVTVKEDMMRRDFTINAMCADVFHHHDISENKVIDFFGGKEDIKNQILRHVNDETFMEDPLRVIRACRIAAKLGFTIHESTVKLCQMMCRNGMMKNISRERIYAEMRKVWQECERPSVFFHNLALTEALINVFPFIYMMVGIPQPIDHHQEGDVYNHTMYALDYAAKQYPKDNTLMFSVMYHDIGKTQTEKEDLPRHHGHDGKPAQILLGEIAKWNKFDNFTKKCARIVVKYHMKFHRIQDCRPFTIVKMFREMKVKHRDDIFSIFAKAGECDEMGRIPNVRSKTPIIWCWLADHFSKHKVELRDDKEFSPLAIKNMVDQQEINCIKEAFRSWNNRKRVQDEIELELNRLAKYKSDMQDINELDELDEMFLDDLGLND